MTKKNWCGSEFFVFPHCDTVEAKIFKVLNFCTIVNKSCESSASSIITKTKGMKIQFWKMTKIPGPPIFGVFMFFDGSHYFSTRYFLETTNSFSSLSPLSWMHLKTKLWFCWLWSLISNCFSISFTDFNTFWTWKKIILNDLLLQSCPQNQSYDPADEIFPNPGQYKGPRMFFGTSKPQKVLATTATTFCFENFICYCFDVSLCYCR